MNTHIYCYYAYYYYDYYYHCYCYCCYSYPPAPASNLSRGLSVLVGTLQAPKAARVLMITLL